MSFQVLAPPVSLNTCHHVETPSPIFEYISFRGISTLSKTHWDLVVINKACHPLSCPELPIRVQCCAQLIQLHISLYHQNSLCPCQLQTLSPGPWPDPSMVCPGIALMQSFATPCLLWHNVSLQWGSCFGIRLDSLDYFFFSDRIQSLYGSYSQSSFLVQLVCKQCRNSPCLLVFYSEVGVYFSHSCLQTWIWIFFLQHRMHRWTRNCKPALKSSSKIWTMFPHRCTFFIIIVWYEVSHLS